jgi:peptidoglycan/xylan/chitin deacetylase (PgdA/CDA1 family)
MKNGAKILMVAAALVAVHGGRSQTVAPPYEVGTWLGFRTAAVSFTFDDGCPNQFTTVIPMFNEFNFKMTLFTVTGPNFQFPPDWTRLRNAAAQGHEVASHTVTHTTFSGMSDSLQNQELKASRNAIESQVTGSKCVTLAYPYCVSAKKSISTQYYIAARICSGSIMPRTPGDFMNISSIICGDQGSVRTSPNFITLTGNAVKSKGWCVFLIHGVDDDGGWSSVSSTALRETLEYLKTNTNDYWVATFGDVARYIRERNAVSVVESSVQDDRITVQVTDTLDNAVFNLPVTLRRPLPEGWPSAVVEQNSRRVNARIVEMDTVRYVQFDVVPDSGDVAILKSNSTGILERSGIPGFMPGLSYNYPNPFNPATTVHFELQKAGRVMLKIFDNRGREIKTLLNGELAAGPHSAVFEADGLASGVYFYGLRAEGFSQYRKMLLLR